MMRREGTKMNCYGFINGLILEEKRKVIRREKLSEVNKE